MYIIKIVVINELCSVYIIKVEVINEVFSVYSLKIEIFSVYEGCPSKLWTFGINIFYFCNSN